QPRRLSVETHCAAGDEMREVVVEGVHEVATERKLMVPANNAYVVVELVRVGLVTVIINRASISKDESACNCEHARPRFGIGAVDLDAHVTVREKLGSDPVRHCPVIGESECLD